MEAGSLPSLEKGGGGFISEKVETINPIATVNLLRSFKKDMNETEQEFFTKPKKADL